MLHDPLGVHPSGASLQRSQQVGTRQEPQRAAKGGRLKGVGRSLTFFFGCLLVTKTSCFQPLLGNHFVTSWSHFCGSPLRLRFGNLSLVFGHFLVTIVSLLGHFFAYPLLQQG